METLPFEMVLKVSEYLTPQDLARCCGVCLDWREMFNDDSHWKPHCDPDLAEELLNTPSVVEPVFVTPEATNDTSLTPISHWRLACMREEQLWRNLKQGNHKEEEVLPLRNEIRRDFLTNTLLVRWCRDRIEIWDVSVTPIVFVARTDPSVDVRGSLDHYVMGNSTLLIEQKAQIKVFHVDALNKQVKLRHNIPLNEASHSPTDIAHRPVGTDTKRVVKEKMYIRGSLNGLSFEIIDLETGELKRNEPLPAVGNGNENARIDKIISSATSDILIFAVCVSDNTICAQYHFYSLKHLTFFQGPELKPHVDSDYHYIEIYRHYLIEVVNWCAVKIFNWHTLEVVYNKTYNGPNEFIAIRLVNNLIFTLACDQGQGWLEVFSLTDRKIKTFLKELNPTDKLYLESIYNKIVYVHCSDDENEKMCGAWKASGQCLEGFDPHVSGQRVRFSKALTRELGFQNEIKVFINLSLT